MNNFFWSLANNLLNKGFQGIFLIVLGNYLFPKEIGLLVTLMLVAIYAVTFSSLQLGSGVVQKLNHHELKEKRNHYFSAGFILTFAIGIFVTVVFFRFWTLIAQGFQLGASG